MQAPFSCSPHPYPTPHPSLHLVWSVWSWSTLLPNWDKYLNTHTHTRRKRQRRSGEETVELRGQMKECWSVDVFFTIALCHISNTDCLKRTIYISQSFTASGWDGSRGKNNVSRRKSGVTGFTERKEKAMLRERLKSRRYKQEFLLAASLCLRVCVCVCVRAFCFSLLLVECTCTIWTFFFFIGFIWVWKKNRSYVERRAEEMKREPEELRIELGASFICRETVKLPSTRKLFLSAHSLS